MSSPIKFGTGRRFTFPAVTCKAAKAVSLNIIFGAIAATATMTGAGCTASAGTMGLTAGASVSITGASCTASAGAVTTTAGSGTSVTGASATASAGSLAGLAGAGASVTGVEATDAAGTLTATGDGNTAVTGAAVQADAGLITSEDSANTVLTGAQIIASAGTLTATGAESAEWGSVRNPYRIHDLPVGASVSLRGAFAKSGAGVLHPSADAAVALDGADVAVSAGELHPFGMSRVFAREHVSRSGAKALASWRRQKTAARTRDEQWM